MISQNYANIGQTLQDVNIKKLAESTKDYKQSKLVAFLKSEYGPLATLVLEQLSVLQKAERKLPSWVSCNCFFTKKSLEQCSSWPLAVHKLELISGKRVVDLSAGLGVDDVAFSQQFKEVIGIDNDKNLNELVRYNLAQLRIDNVRRVDTSAEEWLESREHEEGDVYYIDADRRPEGQQRVYTLDAASPDVLSLIPKIHALGSMVLLKVSPMADINYLLKVCPTAIRITVVGIKNEVKEVLLLLQPNRDEHNATLIEAVEVDENGRRSAVFSQSEAVHQTISEKGSFFYEPSTILIKAGLTKKYADAHPHLELISKNGHYMRSDYLMKSYFGRSFNVLHHGVFSKSVVKKYLKTVDLQKANISARNFVTSVDEIRKTFGLADGGEDYLFFTTSNAGDKLFWHCRKALG